jgi:hypothetical protein
MKHVKLSLLTLWLTACASAPKAPEWTHAGTRVVDNGFIVYAGQAEGNQPERAQFKAEGQALEDLANECSLIPKGTRVEDRYLEHQEHIVIAYVKVAVEFQECDEGRHANSPEQIQKVASLPFTQQLKRYQDLSETGEMPAVGDNQVELPQEIAAAPARDPRWDETTHFYVTRQYVAYEKEVVVLAPPNTYAPGTPAANQFATVVRPSAEQIARNEEQNPQLRKQAWSKLPNHPVIQRPTALTPRKFRTSTHSIRPPSIPREPHANKQPGKRRRRRRKD